jgi:hypothetical protein
LRRPEQRLHPQIQGLVREEPEAVSPEDAILIRARKQIRFAQSLGWGGPPFDMEQFASLLGLRVEYTDKLSSQDSGAIVNGSPIRILVSALDPRVRQRYTIAHEIAHTLLPEPFGRSDRVGWRYRLDAQSPIEMLCQIAASEFLMPSEAVRSLPTQRSLLGSSTEVRNRFDVSHEAAARKVIAMATRPSAGVVLREMNKPSEMTDEHQQSLFGEPDPRPQARLRVAYAFSSPQGPFVPAHKSIPESSRVYELLTGNYGASIEAIEDWVGCFGWESTIVEAVRLGQPGHAFEALCVISQ